jgi:mannose-6-phosphate isomerase-like protein (cupin superfamily)
MNFEERPWGNYTVLHSDAFCQVKKLVVNPATRLSLQSHNFRAEHWFIVSGTGIAQIQGNEQVISPGSSIDIEVKFKHRITCTSTAPLVLIEVQTGTSFDEDDIQRYEDDYGRN